MLDWYFLYAASSLFLFVATFLPSFDSKHWTFRMFDFFRLQILGLLLLCVAIGFFLVDSIDNLQIAIFALLLISIAHHVIIIFPYIPKNNKPVASTLNRTSMLSVNVMQKNDNYDALIAMVKEVQPDILLTMETNAKWEKALAEIEGDFSFSYKIPKENRYGMHLFTKLRVKDCKEHYLIAKEHPSIEARLVDKADNEFIFWGIHPPPPSPTEKPSSKQKDAELMKVATLVREEKSPIIVAGDFNNVCWSKTSKMFSKVSKLKDARLKRGIYGTFPAQFWMLRFPVDLIFHSKSILFSKLNTLAPFGSDHLPILSEFTVPSSAMEAGSEMSVEMEEKVTAIIKEGKKAAVKEN